MGSLSILPLSLYRDIPDSMLYSADLDLCPTMDPGRGSELGKTLGFDSEFYQSPNKDNLYADFARPSWASLPEGYENRYQAIHLGERILARFLEPNDCATSKLVRGEERDIDWIISGLKSDILSIRIIEQRLGTVSNFVDQEEHDRARLLLYFISHHVTYGGPKPPPTRSGSDELGFSNILPIPERWKKTIENGDTGGHNPDNTLSPDTRTRATRKPK